MSPPNLFLSPGLIVVNRKTPRYPLGAPTINTTVCNCFETHGPSSSQLPIFQRRHHLQPLSLSSTRLRGGCRLPEGGRFSGLLPSPYGRDYFVSHSIQYRIPVEHNEELRTVGTRKRRLGVAMLGALNGRTDRHVFARAPPTVNPEIRSVKRGKIRHAASSVVGDHRKHRFSRFVAKHKKGYFGSPKKVKNQLK